MAVRPGFTCFCDRLNLYIGLHVGFDGTESEGKAKGVAQRAPLNDEPNK